VNVFSELTIFIFKRGISSGGSRGIGKEVAILLSRMGANVVICSRTQSEIDSVIKEIKEMIIIDDNKHHYDRKDDRLLGIRCDVSISSEVDHLIESTIAKFKFIDILVNNAGIVFVKKLLDTSEEEWDKTIDTNLGKSIQEYKDKIVIADSIIS
jgi:NAD(P)-dependent dehydrogenase (short-subunit alcohol dehydrogenase family)